MTSFVYGGTYKYINTSGLSLTTTAQVALSALVPPNTLAAGSAFRIDWTAKTSSTADAVIPIIYFGTAGTTSDGIILTGPSMALTTGHDASILITCATPGASGTLWTAGYVFQTNTAGTAATATISQLVPSATVSATGTAPNTTVSSLLTIGFKTSTSTATYSIYNMTIECLF